MPKELYDVCQKSAINAVSSQPAAVQRHVALYLRLQGFGVRVKLEEDS
jgi:hypothetical protein